jgi:hypothetical protein
MDGDGVALGRVMELDGLASLVAQCCSWLAAHASLFGSLAGLLPTDLRETVLRCLADRGLLDDHTFGLLFGPEGALHPPPPPPGGDSRPCVCCLCVCVQWGSVG